ncbi:uncharacterized protein LOC123884093 isoform X2 [Trifolium pratense]|uniref:uncharacterized protein LOC123884093 isoform X2 n=1 Tax=Trifolium pratense TaxID=57577 RepID=UPI001E693154|nr:uncharacterized protein LOC123884093 isoform X2 [Trifolium pratense]
MIYILSERYLETDQYRRRGTKTDVCSIMQNLQALLVCIFYNKKGFCFVDLSQESCQEEKILYKLISGLHSSIPVHIAAITKLKKLQICLVELSLLYIGMQVQHHYCLLFLVRVLVGRESAFCYQNCLEQLVDRPCLENAGLLALTRVGSRRVVQISAVFMIFSSILGKFGTVFASIPPAIVAALYCLFFAYVGVYVRTKYCMFSLLKGISLFTLIVLIGID